MSEHGLPAWPQRANKVRRYQKHLRWLKEIAATLEDDSRAHTASFAEEVEVSIRARIKELQADRKVPNSPSLTPRKSAVFN